MNTLLYSIGLVAMSTMASAQSSGSGSLADLNRLIEANRAEYVKLREELLKTAPGLWDVEAAAARSWEHAVLAFALNHRLRIPDTFADWDKNARRLFTDHGGRLYRFDSDGGARSSDIAGFLLEQSIKPSEGVDKQWPMGELLGRLGRAAKGFAGMEPTAMWRIIWEECPHERLREASLFFLSSSGESSALPTVAEVLRDDGSENGKQFKHRCLHGLFYSNSQEAMDLVLDLWDDLRAQSFTPNGVLAKSANPRAREMMYTLALDPAESSGTRVSTVGLISKYPQPGDRAFLQQFFAKVKSDQLKEQVLRDIAKWFPFEWYREPVREILRTSSDRHVVSNAAFALMRGHGAQTPRADRQRQRKEWTYDAAYRRPGALERARQLDVNAWEEDIALLEEVVQRDTLPQDLRDRLASRLEDMHELRRRFEEQHQGD